MISASAPDPSAASVTSLAERIPRIIAAMMIRSFAMSLRLSRAKCVSSKLSMRGHLDKNESDPLSYQKSETYDAPQKFDKQPLTRVLRTRSHMRFGAVPGNGATFIF